MIGIQILTLDTFSNFDFGQGKDPDLQPFTAGGSCKRAELIMMCQGYKEWNPLKSGIFKEYFDFTIIIHINEKKMLPIFIANRVLKTLFYPVTHKKER